MAGGFKFDSIGHFEFFYSYGAADRTAGGTYTTDANRVLLKSSKEPGKDFTVTKQSSQASGYSIKLSAPNQYLAVL